MSAGDIDFKCIRKEITTLLQEKHPELQPLVIYLCFTECSTYSVEDTGVRSSFSDEQLFKNYKDMLGPICELYTKLSKDHPNLSKADFWTLAATISIDLLGGPNIKWRHGRKDGTGVGISREKRAISVKEDAAQLRQDFKRLGFSDEEGVALCRALTIGGFYLPTLGFVSVYRTEKGTTDMKFDNTYYKDLIEKTWVPDTTTTPTTTPTTTTPTTTTAATTVPKEERWVMYRDANNKEIIRMPSDIALVQDSVFHGLVEKFARNQDEWKEKFTHSFEKLIDLGYTDLHQQQEVV